MDKKINSSGNAWGVSIFCDDLRPEVGNKFSLMGLYLAEIILPVEFPTIIPKFVVFIRYYEIKGAFSDDVILKIHLPGDTEDKPTFTQLFKREDINSAPKPYSVDPEMTAVSSIQFHVVISPFMIPSEGFIKVRAHCGEEVTKLGTLMVRQAREGEIFSV